jgi:hypothetical protein
VEGLSEQVRDNTVSALATLHGLLGLDPSTLRLHKEDLRTTHDCPGRNVDKADIIQRILNCLAEQHIGEHAVNGLTDNLVGVAGGNNE